MAALLLHQRLMPVKTFDKGGWNMADGRRSDSYPLRRRDVDNALKALLDGLQDGGAFADDHQVVRLCVERRSVVRGGKAVVAIKEIKA